ncbi:hypothetical protein BDZ89DRAFT_1133886 [Hymenopellis radicata]|nr:hypothetical protein BDZ89DRAFT_1133886 [Hymenopellis radicata]
MAEATPPPYSSMESTDSAGPLKASMDSANVSEISPNPALRPNNKVQKTAYAVMTLGLIFVHNGMMCPPARPSAGEDTLNDIDPTIAEMPFFVIRSRIIWGLAQLVILVVAASPVLDDCWISHGKLWFVYQGVVIGTILTSPRPPTEFFHLFFTFAVSCAIFHNSVTSVLQDDYARLGTYGVITLSLGEHFCRSLGASEEALIELRSYRSECENRMRMNRSTTDETELLREEKPSKNGGLSVEDTIV